ncbi:MAG: class I adenylate-forming enzyme family protein [Planctomycetaceae bacterium]
MLLGAIDAATRDGMERARRGDAPGLVGPALDRTPLPHASAPALLLDRAAARPEEIGTVFWDGEERLELTHRALAERALRFASALREDLGLKPGDTLAVADLFNHADTLALYHGAWVAGLLVAPLNMREDERRHRFILDHSGAKAIVARDRKDPGAASNTLDAMLPLAGGRPVAQLGGEESRASLRLDRTERPPSTVREDRAGHPALLVYTSGTTGDPKGVLLGQRMLHDVRALAGHHRLGPGDVFQTAMPLFHVNALISSMLLALYTGGRLVLLRRFDPATFFAVAAREGATQTSVVPAMLDALVRAGGDVAPPRLGTIFCGAGQLYPEVARAFFRAYPALRIRHGWGMSETTCWGCHLPQDFTDAEYRTHLLDARFPSIGVPNRAIRMGIVDPTTGRPLAAGERGEIVCGGPGLMEGYFRNAEANAKAFRLGVLQTGDEGYFVEHARPGGETVPLFQITGRLKEVIERGGEKYSTLEIDSDLLKLPGVRRALAYGFTHHRFGQEVGAVLMLQPGASVTAEAVWRHFHALGYPWDKTPKVVRIVEEIPTTATGKDQRLRFAPLFQGLEGERFPRPPFWR